VFNKLNMGLIATLRAIYRSSLDCPVCKLHIPGNICFICYIIPNLWIKKQLFFHNINNYFINQQILNIKGLK